MPGVRRAGAERTALQQAGGKSIVLAIGGDAQMKIATGLPIPRNHLFHYGGPGGEEALKVDVGINAVDDGLRSAFGQPGVKRLCETAKTWVSRIAQAENSVVQLREILRM